MASWNPKANRPAHKLAPKRDELPNLCGLGDGVVLQSTTHPAGELNEESLELALVEIEQSRIDAGDGETEQIDANELRAYMLAFFQIIGDNIPDLAQWRMLHGQIMRSVPARMGGVSQAVADHIALENHEMGKMAASGIIKFGMMSELSSGMRKETDEQADACECERCKAEQKVEGAFAPTDWAKVLNGAQKNNLCGND